jgi:hypothetical protein
MKDVYRIQIRKVYASCPGWPSGGHKSTPVRHKYMLYSTDFSSPLINEDLPGLAAIVFTFDNRFSSTGCAVQQSVRYTICHLQASYLSATSHTGRKSCRVKSLYMKRFWLRPRNSHPTPAFGLIYEGAIGRPRKTTSLCNSCER